MAVPAVDVLYNKQLSDVYIVNEMYTIILQLTISMSVITLHCNSFDTIQYGIFTCTQKLTRWPAKSSTRHRKEKNKKKLKLIELRFYDPVDTKQIISETFSPANLLAKY